MCWCLVTRVQVKIDIKIGNRLFEAMSQFGYFGTTVTNQDLLPFIQNLLSSHLLSRNVKIRI
jgi:hypothetical protein